MHSGIRFLIPQLITFTNLALGTIAILISMNSEPKTAIILILIAAFIDRLDGKIARKLNAESNLGKELDSLSDLISFGVAPIVVAWKIGLVYIGIGGYITAILFVMAGAFRLARYNVINFSDGFVGLPITLAGSFLSLIMLFTSHINIIIIASIALSFLMVSTLKFKKM